MTAAGRTPAQKPHVVIVGAGFGGLYAARALAHTPVRVTLIDKNNYHLFQPMLYQVATGELAADQIAAPIRAVLRDQRNTEVLMAEVTGVDTEKRLVQMGHRTLPYDYLVLATGSHYNYFGHDEWQRHSPSLKSIADATHIRGKLLESFEAAERLVAEGDDDGNKIRDLLTFVLVGAGPTGVEMSGSVAEMSRALLPTYRHLRPDQVRIILVDALPRILNSFPEDLAAHTQTKIQTMGVEVKLGQKVQQVDEDGVTVQDKDGREERIRSRVVLWTAGVVGSSAGQWVNTPVDKDNRIKVNPDFSVPGHDNIFAIGDTASVVSRVRDIFGFPEEKERPLPGVAQPAMQGGQYVAQVIRRQVRGLPPPPPFRYWDKGDLAQVGKGFAVADLKVVRFWGLFAWLLWLGVHIFYLIGFANRLLVMIQWGATVLTAQRGVRDFTPEDAPPVPEVAAAGFPSGH
ncbi:MAG: NAD(P)/FAD-dependent oxidoreductase [Armatimonadetes bacterium]|nr:NAD(P)/FAD-dependent oxidoreductase [Armatimonadota bacterium]